MRSGTAGGGVGGPGDAYDADLCATGGGVGDESRDSEGVGMKDG